MSKKKSKPKSNLPVITITSHDSLDSMVADVVRLKLKRMAAMAAMETEVAAIQKRYAPTMGDLDDNILGRESSIQAYCIAHRAELFRDKKSRETLSAVIGFELTPYRVETSSRKITWKEVVSRLLRLDWGKAYVRNPESQTDKDALLADRAKLTPSQLTSAGIFFAQDEQFFIRPKSQVAEATTKEA